MVVGYTNSSDEVKPSGEYAAGNAFAARPCLPGQKCSKPRALPEKPHLKPECHAKRRDVLGPFGVNFRVLVDHVTGPRRDAEHVGGIQVEAHAEIVTLGLLPEQLVAPHFREPCR